MARKKPAAFTPSPEADAAFGRAIENAHICAATLFGEPLVENPAKDASSRALFMAMGMIYFLARLDAKDMRALGSEGGFGAFNYKPFPPNHVVRKGPFSDLMLIPAAAVAGTA